MPKIKDKERDSRISDIIFADANDEDDIAMGWFYYFSDNLTFPMKATVQVPLRGGGKEIVGVEIVDIETDGTDWKPMRFATVENGQSRVQYISPEHLVAIDTTLENLEIINDWLYAHDFDLLD